jgi:hypothetical protein
MSVTLTWGSANAALADSINVYRATTPLDVNNLPAALATGVAGSATSYTDTTAVRNTLYYYAVGHVRGGNELLSQVLAMGHYPDTGPGPQTLLRGDWNLGYFGTVSPVNMLLPSTLNAQIPLPGTLTADGSVTLWHKFIRKGKVLFIPNYYFASNVQPYQLYNAGLLMGTNDNGNFPFALSASSMNGYTAPANQYKLATVGAYQFIVRTIKASDKPSTSYISLATDIFPSEWTDLMGRLGNTSLAASPQDKWNDLAGNAGWTNFWSQNFTIASSMGLINGATNQDVIATSVMSNGYAQTYNWLPVLELILT